MVRHHNFICKPFVNSEFGIRVKENLKFVEARVLSSPRVIFGLCLFELFRQSYGQI
jgi:hypothetical protein